MLIFNSNGKFSFSRKYPPMKYLFLRFIFVLVLASCGGRAFAQQKTVSGRVTDAQSGAAVPGVSVVIKGTTNGTQTDSDGRYQIKTGEGRTVLQFSFIGLEPQELSVGNRSVVNLQMSESATELTQVVITGYNSTQKKDIIGSVAVVNNSKFKEIPVVGIDQALQGQAAGVQVTQSSGTPGGGIKVNIRGNTSISASNKPLYVVDGIPVFDGALTNGYGGQTDNALSFINPNDIESIQVLKDASAKAIYGSRAANGVVVISTKRGKGNNRTVITADVQRGVTQVVKKIDLLNASELLDLQIEAVKNAITANPNLKKTIGGPEQLGLVKGVTDATNTRWLDEVLRQGVYQQYQISATGGSDRTTFYMSGNMRDEEGVQLNNRFTRYGGTLNLEHKANNKLKFGTNITLGGTRNNRVVSDNTVAGVYGPSLRSLPYNTPANEKGKLYGYNDVNYPGFPNGNPVGEALLNRQLVLGLKMLGGIFVEYEMAKNLKFRTKGSIDYNAAQEDIYNPVGTFLGSIPGLGGSGYGEYSTSSVSTWLSSSTLTYNHQIGDKHHFSELLGVEALQTNIRSSFVNGRLFPSADFTYIGSAGVTDDGSSSLSQNGLLSAFGEIKYDYAEKYLVALTARADGSSRFGPNRKYGFFPSLSAAWRISEENFMKRFSFVQDIKLRASVGYTGNERIGNFQFLNVWSSTTYNGLSGLGPNRVGSPGLQWERTREMNVGLDASFWNGRVSIVFDAYSNLTDNLLFAQPVPFTTGFGTVQGNIGAITNKGLEFTLSTVNIDRAVRWSTDINISQNINKITQLASEQPIQRGFQSDGVGSTNVVKQGEPLGTFWGFKFLGVDAATGDAIYDDFNKDGIISASDAQPIGNAQPKLIGGITNRISWKGFDVSGFFQFSYGNKVLNFANEFLLNPGTDLRSNQVRAALRRWQKPGDITDVPRYEYQNNKNSFHSSRYIEDGSYLRLKNVTIGYNIPKKWAAKIKMNTVRVFLSGTNLWTLTRYTGGDPEISTFNESRGRFDDTTIAQGVDFFTLPQVKTLMGGLTVSF